MQHRTNSICGLKPPKTPFIRFADGPEAPVANAKGYCSFCIYICNSVPTNGGGVYINSGDETAATWVKLATVEDIPTGT